MPNPRYLTPKGEPTVELLDKMLRGKQVFNGNLDWFCRQNAYDPAEIGAVEGIYLIGSHANPEGWCDETSDLDFKIVNAKALPAQLHHFKREVLDKLLHTPAGEKKRWIDFFFARETYQVTEPKFDLTSYWNGLR